MSADPGLDRLHSIPSNVLDASFSRLRPASPAKGENTLPYQDLAPGG